MGTFCLSSKVLKKKDFEIVLNRFLAYVSQVVKRILIKNNVTNYIACLLAIYIHQTQP